MEEWHRINNIKERDSLDGEDIVQRKKRLIGKLKKVEVSDRVALLKCKPTLLSLKN